MKFFLTSLIIFLSLSAAGERILVMDTLEFNTVQHNLGKRRYVSQLTELMKKLRLKEGDFDAMNADQHVVYELIQSKNRWKAVTKQIELSCQKKENKKTCDDLENARLATFDFIGDNPESVEEVPAEEATR